MINSFGSEFKILLEEEIEKIKSQFGEEVGEAIYKVRAGDIHIEPGYDGVFGKVKIWGEERENLKQEALF
jgi:PHP family Zn ribbon phosphoesterase